MEREGGIVLHHGWIQILKIKSGQHVTSINSNPCIAVMPKLVSVHSGRVLLGSTVAGWLDFLCSFEENRFWLVWLINFFNRPQTRLKWLKINLRDHIA